MYIPAFLTSSAVSPGFSTPAATSLHVHSQVHIEGYSAIPDRWRDELQDESEIREIAGDLSSGAVG